MNTLILLTALMITPSTNDKVIILPPKEIHITHYLVLRAQDLDGMVYGWCVDERGWHEFEAESASDYLEAGFKACKEG